MPKQKGGQKAEKVRAGGKLGTYSRRTAISFEACCPNSLAAFSTASRSSAASTSPSRVCLAATL